MPYLDPTEFTLRTIAPKEYVDYVEGDQPNWLSAQLTLWSRWIDSRLNKRYTVPFDEANPPEVIRNWLARIVTWELYLKRGVNPNDQQCELIKQRADEAMAEIKEAADSADGLFELPLRESTPTQEGVSRGNPLAYTEVSPYTWSYNQRTNSYGDPFA